MRAYKYILIGGGKELHIKRKVNRFSVPSIAAMVLLVPFVLAGCQTNAAPSASESASSVVSSPGNEIELLESKPKVAEVEANNVPNRIITTLNGDTQTQMGFNWYTTDKFDDAKVWVSTSEDLSDPLIFEPEADEVTNQYAERTEEGFYIYADLEMDEEGNPVEGENSEPVVNGYYTDEGKSGPEWTSGDAVGSLDLVDVTEYSYKALATDLEPSTTYYYQVGSETRAKRARWEHSIPQVNQAMNLLSYNTPILKMLIGMKMSSMKRLTVQIPLNKLWKLLMPILCCTQGMSWKQPK